MGIKMTALLGVAVASSLAISSVGKAASVDFTTLISYGPDGVGTLNSLTDANGENLIKGAGNTGGGIIEVGDYLTGVFDYNRISPGLSGYPGTQIGSGTAYSELTGIFLLQVTSKTAAGGGTFNFTFGADSAKFASLYGLGGLSAGTMIRLFDDVNPNFTLSGTNAGSIASATDGVQFMDVGFTGVGGTAAAGEGWLVLGGSDNFGALASQPYSTTLGTANFAVDRTSNAGAGGGLVLIKQTTTLTTAFGGSAEFVGSSTIKGSAGTGIAWTGASQTNLDFIAAVPVPTAAWMGLPLLGVMGGIAALRRRSAKLA